MRISSLCPGVQLLSFLRNQLLLEEIGCDPFRQKRDGGGWGLGFFVGFWVFLRGGLLGVFWGHPFHG